MIVKRLLLAGALCLLLCAMRDPFLPPPDACRIAQLTRWHFHGVVAGKQAIGFLRDADGRWHRVTPGERLPGGWRVTSVSVQEIAIATGAECQPAQWRWQREGTQDEKMVSGHDALRSNERMGANAEPRHADAG